MTAAQLHQALLDEGLNVRQYPGWERRGGLWGRDKPVGFMHHHTAAPVPYPVDRLAGPPLIKCNQNVKPDGTIWLVAYGACNYSSGSGSSTVLAEVLAGDPPTANARDRDLSDDTNGNPLFWNSENDHPGHGEPLPDVQLDAIVRSTRVVNEHFGITPAQDISHAEWTARKTDPYWNDDRRCIEEIRTRLEEDMKQPLEWWAEKAFAWAIKRGLYTEADTIEDVRETYDFQRVIVFKHRFWTKIIRPTISAGGVTVAAVIAEIVARLGG